MPARLPIKAGDEFEGWTVLAVIYPGGNTVCECRCKCGTVRKVLLLNLRQKKSKNCGCDRNRRTAKRNETHGGTHTKLYRIWYAMKNRCENPRVSFYPNYGGRGIAISDEWSTFLAFRQWAESSGYDESLTIERKDVNKGYEPDNCCWIPAAKQSRNRTDTIYLTAFGEKKGLADWAEDSRCKVKYALLKNRYYYGWTHEDAISTPKTHKWSRKRNSGRATKNPRAK